MFGFFSVQLDSNTNTSMNSIQSYVVGLMGRRDLRAQMGGSVGAGVKLMWKGAESTSGNSPAEGWSGSHTARVPTHGPCVSTTSPALLACC